MSDFDTLKIYATTIAGYYSLSDREDFRRYADRMINCAPFFDLRLVPGSRECDDTLLAHVHDVRWCRCRHCCLCQWARVAKSRAKFFQGLPRLHNDYPDHQWISAVFTVENVSVEHLRSQVLEMSAAWSKLLRRRRLCVAGYVQSLEVTRSELGEAHPHYHCLLLMPPEYFTDTERYLSQQQWSTLWAESLGVDYQPVVFVRKVYRRSQQDWIEALLEVVKYSVKPADLVADADWLYALTDQLHQLRAVTVGGLVSDYVSQSALNQIDSALRSGDEQHQSGIPAHLDWDYLDEAYGVTSLGSLGLLD